MSLDVFLVADCLTFILIPFYCPVDGYTQEELIVSTKIYWTTLFLLPLSKEGALSQRVLLADQC